MKLKVPPPRWPLPGTAAAAFPPADIEQFRGIVTDTLAKVNAGDQAGATARITDLETAWDDAQARLQLMNDTAWASLDARIDAALKAVRAAKPDADAEKQALGALLTPRCGDGSQPEARLTDPAAGQAFSSSRGFPSTTVGSR